MAEKAIGYFERAALMQPSEVKWQLMSASCHRRIGNYHQALQAYKDIHARFPDNIECECHFILHDIKTVSIDVPSEWFVVMVMVTAMQNTSLQHSIV